MVIVISELAYSLHLGSDKNKKNNVRNSAKNNISGTSSMSNNAIQNAKQLSKVDHHNYRMYDNKQDEIIIVKGTSSLYKDIENFYKNEFEEARIEYNNKQTRNDRKINNYFKKVSDNSKSDLACEMIIELGDKKFWDTKSLNYKHKMTSVYSKQVNDLEMLVPNFKICSAIIHYDETSPHMHIVGVPIKYNCKTGMSIQVGKTSIFTKESLVVIQDKMRERCINEFNQVYQLDNTLKKKQKGKNRDITPYERKIYNEKVKGLKQEISNLKNEVSDLEDNKESINKQITKLNKDITDIVDEIDKKKKINNKVIIKSKNQLWDENEKLKEENEDLKRLNYQYEHKYNDLKEKTDYLINHLNKVFQKLPEFIKTIVDHLFNHSGLGLKYFKQQYDPEVKRKEQSIFKGFNLFNKKEIEKATKHINYEMEESAADFYTDKEDKEKDDGFEL